MPHLVAKSPQNLPLLVVTKYTPKLLDPPLVSQWSAPPPGLSSCATSLPKEGHAAQPHANTSITATITTTLAHTQVTNAPDSPVQTVDLAQKEKITCQANLPSNTVVILSNDVTETGESIKYSSKIGKYCLKTVKL